MESYYEISSFNLLKRELEKYKNILSKSVYEYLDALISLETSPVKDIFNTDEEEIISCLPFYKSIVKYNIYNHALQLLNSKNIKLCERSDYQNRTVNMFSNLKLNNTSRTIDILNLTINGSNEIELNLFNSLSDDNVKEKELLILQKKIDELNNNATKSYISFNIGELIGWHSDFTELSDNYKYLEKYKKAMKKINSRKDLSKNDREEILLANEIYNLLLEEYGISDDDFTYEGTDYITTASHKYMNKKRVKTKKGIKVISNNYYL